MPPHPDPPPEAAGNVRINVSLATIETTGYASYGISAENHGGAGRIDVDVSNSTITTLWDTYGAAHGISAWRRGTTTGDVEVTVHDTDITTKSYGGMGINVDHQGEDTGNIIIDVEFGRIDTANRNGYAIRGFRSTATATSISTLTAPSSKRRAGVPTASMSICIKPAAISTCTPRTSTLRRRATKPTVSTPGCNKNPWAG